MPICRKCRRNIAKNFVSCVECKNSFHPGCLINFTANKSNDHCCRWTSDQIKAKATENNETLQAEQPAQQSLTQSEAYDTARGLPSLNDAVSEGSSSPFPSSISGDSVASRDPVTNSPVLITPVRPSGKRQISPPSPSLALLQSILGMKTGRLTFSALTPVARFHRLRILNRHVIRRLTPS